MTPALNFFVLSTTAYITMSGSFPSVGPTDTDIKILVSNRNKILGKHVLNARAVALKPARIYFEPNFSRKSKGHRKFLPPVFSF